MKRTSPLFVGTLYTLLSCVTSAAEPDKAHDLRSARKPGDLDRVTIQLEVGGNINSQGKEGKPEVVPMSGAAELEYHEKTLAIPAGGQTHWRTVRHYDKADAAIKVGQREETHKLRADRRLIVGHIDAGAATLFCPRGPLTRDELELIDLLGNSALFDQFLPEKPVPVGHRWKPSDKLLALLRGLDSVTGSDVEITLKEVTDTVARFEMSGSFTGRIYDVTTKVEVKAKYRYDLRIGRIDWFGLLAKEERPIGKVENGSDVVIRLQVRILPAEASAEASAELAEEKFKDLPLQPVPELTRLVHRGAEDRWSLLYDRNWHLVDEHREGAALRLIAKNEYIGQCSLTVLPQRSPDKLSSLEEFQDDLRRALDKNFGAFVEAKQYADARERRVYRVAVDGQVAEVPLVWIYFWVADREGRQAVLALTAEKKLAERLSPHDEELLAGFQFAEPKTKLRLEAKGR